MDQKSKFDVATLIEKLSKAGLINTDITLAKTLDIVSALSSADIDGVDFWCGTIRRPWVWIKPPVVGPNPNE